MIHKATRLIDRALTEKSFKHASQDLQQFSFVEAGFSGDNTTFKLRFISPDEDNDVKAMTEDIVKVPEAKRSACAVILNALNTKYKYAKFTMDSKGGVCAQYDFPLRLSDSDVGPVAVEICLRFAQIVDEAYPEIMKSVWG